MDHRLPKTWLPSWTPATTATVAVTLGAALVSAGFGDHRAYSGGWSADFVPGMIVHSVIALLLGTVVVRSTRSFAAVGAAAGVIVFFLARGCYALFLYLLGEPTPEQSNASAEVAWLVSPLIFAFSAAPLLSFARGRAARSSLEPRWAVDLRAGLFLLSITLGSLIALRGTRGHVGSTLRAIVITGAALGLGLVIDRAVARRRARRLAELASLGETANVIVRPLQPGEELLPSLASEDSSNVVAVALPRTGGGPFRVVSEEKAVFRWDPSDKLAPLDGRAVFAALFRAAVWVGFGLFSASTSLDPNHPPLELATRYQHMPLLRVTDPALELEGHSFWRAPSPIVAYDEERDAIVDPPDEILRRYPETDSLGLIARRSSLLRHACAVITSGELTLESGERIKAAPPRRAGDTVEYECTSLSYPDGPPVTAHRLSDSIAPQQLLR